MTPLQAIKTGFRKSFVLKGRATPSEFWWLSIFLVAAFLLSNIGPMLLLGPNYSPPIVDYTILVTPLLMFPILAAGVRRNHDTGVNGFLSYVFAAAFLYSYLLVLNEFCTILFENQCVFVTYRFLAEWFYLFCIIGAVAALAWLVPSNNKSNKYGPNPSEVIQ